MSEAQEAKARAYLADGRVVVHLASADYFLAVVRGAKKSYSTRYTSENGWRCDCEARTNECSHIIACKLISSLREPEPVYAPPDPSLDNLFKA